MGITKGKDGKMVPKDWFVESHKDGERSFDMTREGFALLVMGWDDKKSENFKIAYIEAFESMLAVLKEHQPYVAATILQRLRALFPDSPEIRRLFEMD
jgi:phage regulator Rha-like protein